MSVNIKIPQLLCNTTVEYYSQNSSLSKRIVIIESVLSLGRNQFKDIVLKVDEQKTGKARLEFVLVDNKDNYRLNTKFANEGKASICLNEKNVRIFISNCASNELKVFLKCFSLKCNYYNTNTNYVLNSNQMRERLITAKTSSFETISPLTDKDLKRNALNKSNKDNIQAMTNQSPKTSKPLTVLSKRKLNGENCNDMNSKKKFINSLIPSPVRQMKVLNEFKLNDRQRRVMNTVLCGRNVFFTGSAGTGKSYLLKFIISRLPPETTFVTASTGIAASHIGGITLHMFSGINTDLIVNKNSPEECAKRIMSNNAAVNKWRKCKVLIIDEISMVCGYFLNLLENVSKIIKSNDKPFGGIQLIFCGDFLQLPPITKKGEKKFFSFECEAWDKCIDHSFELNKIIRQSDKKFIDVLQSLRIGKCNDDMKSLLLRTALNDLKCEDLIPTKLFTHRNDVNAVNTNQLNRINSQSMNFEAMDSDPKFSSLFDNICPTNRKLDLKIGAQVMLNKNIDMSRGLVNGLNGIIVKFEKQMNSNFYPKIRFTNGTEAVISPEKWMIRVSADKYVTRRHLPLQLSYALSIHKSQGMTINNGVEISLGRVFECGQSYVALSRAKSLDKIRIIDFNPNSIIVDSAALEFYKNLKYS